LVNFKGTDTISGLLFAREYYNAGIAGHSIPATEHSCITSWGRENEAQAYRNLIKQFGKPGSIFACVSDSYDIFNACENIWGEELKAEVVDSGATLVIRPDSGQPEEVCVKVIQILGEKFGYTVNNKGYKVLNNVRIIQGDGVTESMINCILGHFAVLGWSADNIAFGAGGYLLQQLDRDTNKWAMKCSSVRVLEECTVNRGDGYYDKGTEHVWKDVYKDPITDHGKKSKKGRVTLWTNPAGEFVSSVTPPTGWTDKGFYGEWTEALYEVYRDGNLTKEYTFEEVRTNTN
jgi:nicotinamide phosphoribosyltransferase